ncbi:hypothetical protein GWK47_050620 [Chionoecetes opilio]|uniref:Uncharacterized protein n=1 Tax=Chionoecetes opilio TaxID=41210 RepID=A0A8J4YAM8_CHIOP|nr:hypothetical protein GWK47_050620 [Chionoecetes opilio]
MVRIDGSILRSRPRLGFANAILHYHDEVLRNACFTLEAAHFRYLTKIDWPVLFDSRPPCLRQTTLVRPILYDEEPRNPPKRINHPIITSSAATLPLPRHKNSLRPLLSSWISRPTSFPPTLGLTGIESYVEACANRGLSVVNDTAERGFAHPVLQDLRLPKTGTAPVPSSKFWRPIASQPGT